MLVLTLFCAVFSSIIWAVYAIRFVVSSLSGISFFDAGILNVLLYTLFVCLPIFIIWAIFGFVSQYINNHIIGRQMFRLFSQMKKNQEYSDLLARIMLETEQNIKNSFVLSRFDLLIGDMNELLSEILQRERLVSSEQIEHLWCKVQNGGKWSFGKVLIENYNRQPSFQKKVFTDASADTLLAGTIMEFCARYQTLLTLLEKHDKEKIFLNIIETGVFGKVFAVLAPVSDEIRRTRETITLASDSKDVAMGSGLDKKQQSFKDIAETPKGFFERILPTKKVSSGVSDIQKDAFSLALERSFSDETDSANSDTSPDFNISVPEESMPEIQIAPKEQDETVIVSDTQKMLNSLKKEWQDIDVQNSSPKNEDLTYPFSGWTDADNYQK